VNIILNLIAFFSQNEVPLLLSFYIMLSKCNDVIVSLWRHCIITNHFW